MYSPNGRVRRGRAFPENFPFYGDAESSSKRNTCAFSRGAVRRASFQEAHSRKSSIDGNRPLPQHKSTMAEIQYDRTRRSSRVFMRVRVVVAGKNLDGRKFREACETIVINAHGGLLYLNQPLENGAMIVLINPFTQDEQECRIVFLGDGGEKGQRIGVEFLSPAPHFWGVEFEPADWPPRAEPARPN